MGLAVFLYAWFTIEYDKRQRQKMFGHQKHWNDVKDKL